VGEGLANYYGYLRPQPKPYTYGREEPPADYFGYEYPQRKKKVQGPYVRGIRGIPGAASPEAVAAREAARAEAFREEGIGAAEPLTTSPFTDIYQQRYGIPTVGGEEQGFIYGDFRDTELPLSDEIQERVNEQKAEVKGTLLKRGVRPMNFTDFERKVIGKSDEEMNEMGYVWDEEQQLWIHSDVLDDFPQTVGAALPGYGYTYNYPRGYGYGRGGEYTYPQSFARQGQRGRVPSMVRNRPGSFGVVLWRI
jgi:hypothetical protein